VVADGHAMALVHENDLYVVPDAELVQSTPTPIRVTNDGSAVVFNGVPDWVYEEDVPDQLCPVVVAQL
jgi:dipeptidyl aminopeptidase